MRRIGIIAASAGLLATTIAGTPAQAAAPEDWPVGDWASACADDTDVYCIESAWVVPVASDPMPISEAGLTASVSTEPDDLATSMRWAVDGWAGQPEEITDGAVQFTIRTGSFVPRMTTAVAGPLDVSRAEDIDGNFRLTVTARPARVNWTTGEYAQVCAAHQYCGDPDTMADEDGTGFRLEGRTDNLENMPQEYIDAMDGAYFSTDAQTRLDMVSNGVDGDELIDLGTVGNPQLDLNGNPVRNSVVAFLPPNYFSARGTSAWDALENGIDVVGHSGFSETAVPVQAGLHADGLVMSVSEIGFGEAMGRLTVHARQTTPAELPMTPENVQVTGTDEGIAVSWDDAAGHRVRVWDAPTGGAIVMRRDAEVDEDSVLLTDLEAGEVYYVSVSGVNTLGESDPTERFEVTAGTSGVVAPTPPLNVKVTPGANKLIVTWSQPESDGGAPIDNYWVNAYFSKNSDTEEPVSWCSSSAAKRTCTINNPKGNAAKLYVAAIASNEAGDSAESVRAVGQPWVVASAPRSVKATSARGKVTVTWTTPSVVGNGVALTGYRAELYTTAKGGSPAAKCTAKATAKSCTTGSLKAGKVYYATVIAQNKVGDSPQATRVKVTIKK